MPRPLTISLLMRCLEDYQVLARGLGIVDLQLHSDLCKLASLLQPRVLRGSGRVTTPLSELAGLVLAGQKQLFN